jgi:nucleoside transporter
MPNTSLSNSSPTPAMPMGLRLNLSVMMFLQFAIWGSWFTVLGNRLAVMGLGDYIGSIYGTMALGAVITPMFFGQIADRYFSSEKLMAVLHLAGAGLLFWMSQIPPVSESSQAGATSWLFWSVALGYSFVYSPTLALANTIAFTHVPNGQRDFPGIRVLGTIGWIVAGWTVGLLISKFVPNPQVSNAPLILAAALSALLGIYSLFLPHTPPKGKAGDAIPFLRALKLLKEPSFAVFFGASFLITIVLAFYYNYTGLYLERRHEVKDVATTMTIGQVSEMILLPFLPWFLWRFGMKAVLAMGMLAWGVRYGIFSLGDPFWLVLVGVALHGVCFDFFFAAGFIHVDKEAPSDIRGSGQALFAFLTYGLAMWLGSEFSNYIFAKYTTEVPAAVTTQTTQVHEWFTSTGWVVRDYTSATSGKMQQTDWQTFWLVPSIGVLIALSIFVLFFRMRRRPVAGAPPAA